MTIESIKNDISDIIDSNSSIAEIFFVLKVDVGYPPLVKRANFSPDAQRVVKDQFKNELNSEISQNDDVQLMKISTLDYRTNTIYEYDIPDADKSQEILLLDHVCKNNTFIAFDPTSESERIKGVIIRVSEGSKQIALFKHVYPVNFYKKESILKINLSNRIVETAPDPMIRIGSGFDFFILNNKIYIKNFKLLERSYGFDRFIKDRANTILQKIKNLNFIFEIQSLEDRTSELSFCRKLSRISQNSSLLDGSVSDADIIYFISNHDDLKTKLVVDSVTGKISVKHRNTHGHLIKFLECAYLEFSLTGEKFIAHVKDKI